MFTKSLSTEPVPLLKQFTVRELHEQVSVGKDCCEIVKLFIHRGTVLVNLENCNWP
jgi:hypothetical protein